MIAKQNFVIMYYLWYHLRNQIVMREYTKKPESQSRTLDSNPKASRQAPIDVILQRYKERNIQRFAKDEELIQGNFDTAQREKIDEDELLQGKFKSVPTDMQKSIQREERPNNTGLPDNLKTGIENLSGYSMDDVRVHYNSHKPVQLQALAYTQGADIDIAPGQERHLSHEAWHVVQQKQGRVQPIMQLQGLNVNDNEGLEKEADVMGDCASKNIIDKSKSIVTKNSHITSVLQRYSIVKKDGDIEEVAFSYKENQPDYNGKLGKDGDGYYYFNKTPKQTQCIYERTRTSSQTIEINAIRKGKEEEFKSKKAIIENAFGFGTGNLKIIIDSQKIYQNWIISLLSKQEIMDSHRSIGLEYEFATFNGGDLSSHEILAKSEILSNLFNLPFILETDSGNELELGTPPLLVEDINGKPNVISINRIHNIFKNVLQIIRDDHKDKLINTIPLENYGLGGNWTWEEKSDVLSMTDRNKHLDSDKMIYSQLNISLTPEEAASYMDGEGKKKYNSYAPRAHEQFMGDITKRSTDMMLKPHATILNIKTYNHRS